MFEIKLFGFSILFYIANALIIAVIILGWIRFNKKWIGKFLQIVGFISALLIHIWNYKTNEISTNSIKIKISEEQNKAVEKITNRINKLSQKTQDSTNTLNIDWLDELEVILQRKKNVLTDDFKRKRLFTQPYFTRFFEKTNLFSKQYSERFPEDGIRTSNVDSFPVFSGTSFGLLTKGGIVWEFESNEYYNEHENPKFKILPMYIPGLSNFQYITIEFDLSNSRFGINHSKYTMQKLFPYDGFYEINRYDEIIDEIIKVLIESSVSYYKFGILERLSNN